MARLADSGTVDSHPAGAVGSRPEGKELQMIVGFSVRRRRANGRNRRNKNDNVGNGGNRRQGQRNHVNKRRRQND
jgi:hypothetical protein